MNGRSSKNGKKIKVGFRFTWKDLLLYGFLFFFLIFIVMGIGDLASTQTGQEIPISKVVQDIKDKKVSEIAISDTKIDVKYKNGKTVTTTKEANVSLFDVLKNSNIDPNSIKIQVKDQATLNTWINLISSF